MTKAKRIDRPDAEAKCSRCGMTKPTKASMKDGRPCLPIGWKSVSSLPVCKVCMATGYAIRAVNIPVACPAEGSTWGDLWDAVRSVGDKLAALATWACDELAKNDVVVLPGEKKLKPMPKIYLYGLAGERFPLWEDIPKNTANAVLRAAEGKYRAQRYDVLMTRSAQRPVYSKPQPIPFKAGDAKLFIKDERIHVSIPLGKDETGKPKRFEVILAGGHEHRRQTAGLKWLMENPDFLAECTVVPLIARKSDHRGGATTRENGGGTAKKSRLMFKVVGRFPREQKAGDKTMRLRTDKDALLVLLDAQDQRFSVYNYDHVNRILAMHNEHLKQCERWRNDLKAERRRSKRDRIGFDERREAAAKKNLSRMQSLTHELSASVVKWLKRLGACEVVYDDSEQSYCHSFRWAMMREKIATKCHVAGIDFRWANEPTTSKRNRKKKKGEDDAAGMAPVPVD